MEVKHQTRNRLLNLVVGLGITLVAPITFASTYTSLLLGSLGGNNSYATALNNKGQVVGMATVSGDTMIQGVIWQPGSVTPIVLGNFVDPNAFNINGSNSGYPTSYPLSINDNGQIVGTASAMKNYYSSNSFELSNRSAIWQIGSTTPTELFSVYGAVPMSINNSGQVAGARNSIGPVVFWSSAESEPAVLSGLGGDGYGRVLAGGNSSNQAMNSSGQMVGYTYSTDTGKTLATIWQYGFPAAFLQPNSEGVGSFAYAINNNGQVVGSILGANNSYAALWQPGSTIPTDISGGQSYQAVGINDNGQIVGSMINKDGNSAAAFWHSGSVAPIDLNTLVTLASDDYLIDAIGINNSGQIIAWGISPNKTSHAYLLTPVAVPIPGSIWLFSAIFIIPVFRIRRTCSSE